LLGFYCNSEKIVEKLSTVKFLPFLSQLHQLLTIKLQVKNSETLADQRLS
jgi:hypothetical protein